MHRSLPLGTRSPKPVPVLWLLLLWVPVLCGSVLACALLWSAPPAGAEHQSFVLVLGLAVVAARACLLGVAQVPLLAVTWFWLSVAAPTRGMRWILWAALAQLSFALALAEAYRGTALQSPHHVIATLLVSAAATSTAAVVRTPRRAARARHADSHDG